MIVIITIIIIILIMIIIMIITITVIIHLWAQLQMILCGLEPSSGMKDTQQSVRMNYFIEAEITDSSSGWSQCGSYPNPGCSFRLQPSQSPQPSLFPESFWLRGSPADRNQLSIRNSRMFSGNTSLSSC